MIVLIGCVKCVPGGVGGQKFQQFCVRTYLREAPNPTQEELKHTVGSDRALSKLTVEPRGGKRDLIAFHPPLPPSMHGHYFGPSNNRRALSALHIYRGREGGEKARGLLWTRREGVGRDGSSTRGIRRPGNQQINFVRQASCQRVILSGYVVPMFPHPLLDGRLLRITLR